MKPWVVDASVAAKWVLPAVDEPFALEAQAILAQLRREEITLIVPDLFWSELANVLWSAVRRDRISNDHARQGMEEVLWLGLRTFPSTPLIAHALDLALKHGRTAYDSLYLACAMEVNGSFLTADEKLVNSLGTYFPVRWLGALSLL